jgi:hypothetical protein
MPQAHLYKTPVLKQVHSTPLKEITAFIPFFVET